MRKDTVSFIIGMGGVASVTVGVCMLSWPFGIITFGILCLIESWLIARTGD